MTLSIFMATMPTGSALLAASYASNVIELLESHDLIEPGAALSTVVTALQDPHSVLQRVVGSAQGNVTSVFNFHRAVISGLRRSEIPDKVDVVACEAFRYRVLGDNEALKRYFEAVIQVMIQSADSV